MQANNAKLHQVFIYKLRLLTNEPCGYTKYCDISIPVYH